MSYYCHWRLLRVGALEKTVGLEATNKLVPRDFRVNHNKHLNARTQDTTTHTKREQ